MAVFYARPPSGTEVPDPTGTEGTEVPDPFRVETEVPDPLPVPFRLLDQQHRVYRISVFFYCEVEICSLFGVEPAWLANSSYDITGFQILSEGNLYILKLSKCDYIAIAQVKFYIVSQFGIA